MIHGTCAGVPNPLGERCGVCQEQDQIEVEEENEQTPIGLDDFVGHI